MSLVDLVMPKMGESIMEATILKWSKQPGDAVKQDETVLEIATDKVDSEVPSTTAGILEEILYKVNDVVPIGSVIARIRTTAEATGSSQPSQPSNEGSKPAATPQDKPQPAAAQQTHTQPVYTSNSNGTTNGTTHSGARFYSPL